MKNRDKNFFLVDDNGEHYYLLNIYCEENDRMLEYDFTEELKDFDFEDYVKFCELISEHYNYVYLEIVNEEWDEKYGWDRFWCDINTRQILDTWIPKNISNKYVNYEVKK